MSHRTHRRALAAAVVAVLTLGALVASAADHRAAAGDARVVYGSALALGQGSARTYVALDHEGVPVTFGVAVAEGALAHEPTAATLMLPVPATVRWAGYDHVLLEWQPRVDDPAPSQPRLAFRFYTSAESGEARVRHEPVGHARLPDGVSAAGAHGDTTIEIDGRRFTRTFIYGAFDGQFVAFEPVITAATLAAARANGQSTEILTLPGSHAGSGRYATSYAVAYDAAAREYRVALHALGSP
jgi:hypothetical protein